VFFVVVSQLVTRFTGGKTKAAPAVKSKEGEIHHA
jgi:hypothetical protein